MIAASPLVLRRRVRAYEDLTLAIATIVGAATCVLLTVILASGTVIGSGFEAVAVAAFLLVALWCLTHRRVDHTLLVLALYLGLLDGYVKLSTGSSTITLARDALVIAIAAGALARSIHARERLHVPPLGGFVLAFTAAVLIELANPAARNLAVGLAGVRQHLEFVPLFFLGYAVIRTEARVRNALLLLVFCAAIGGVVSYAQSKLTPEQLAGWGPGYRERIDGTGIFTGAGRIAVEGTTSTVRPFGLGSEAGSGALLAALALPGLVALLITGSRRLRWLMLPMSVGVGLAVATSGSRGALILVFVSLLAFGLIAAASRNALKAILGVALGVAVVYGAFVQLGPDNASTKRAQSVTPSKAVATFSAERGSSVAAFGNLAWNHPLGVGVGTSGPASGFQRSTSVATFNTETQWNFLIVETGLLGLIIYVTFLLRLSWLAMVRIRRVTDPVLRLQLAALAAPIISMIVAGFSGPTSASTPTGPFLWLVGGVLAYWLATELGTRNPRARGTNGHEAT